MRSAGREPLPRRSPRWRRASPLCETSAGWRVSQLRRDDLRRPSTMKGKERSPVKPKRSRGGEDSSSRGERSKKLGGSGGSNGSSSGKTDSGGSRRSLHLDKSSSRGGSREYETGGGKVAQLKITQRLRLDQPKLDEVTRRIKVAGPNGYAILLAVPGSSDSRSSSSSATSDTAASTQRPLRNLVSYLKQKQAAGVISLPVGGNKDKENTGVLHAFPPCEFSQQFLDSPAKALAKSEEDYLVMIIVRAKLVNSG